MSKFKVGDKVRRVKGEWLGNKAGDEATIRSIVEPGCDIDLEGYIEVILDANCFELVKSAPVPRPHAELIKAWADGHKIEYLFITGHWREIECPQWKTKIKYRIKTDKSPEQLEKEAIKEEMDKLSKRLEELNIQ